MFDDVLDISSKSLNKAKSVIDKYDDIFNQPLTSEIASDDDKSIKFKNAPVMNQLIKPLL